MINKRRKSNMENMVNVYFFGKKSVEYSAGDPAGG